MLNGGVQMSDYYICNECGWTHDKEITKGVCPRRKKEFNNSYQHERNPEIDRFYHSKVWKETREQILKRDICCQRCLFLYGLINYKSLQVHHIRKIEFNWDERTNLNNLVTLCATCHRQVDITCPDGTLDFDFKPKDVEFNIF